MTRADLLEALDATRATLLRDEATLRARCTAATAATADEAFRAALICALAQVELADDMPGAEERARRALSRWGSAALRERLAGRVPPVEPRGAA